MMGDIPQVIVLENERFALSIASELLDAGINGERTIAGVVVRAQDVLAKVRQYNASQPPLIDGVSVDHNVVGMMSGTEMAAILRAEFPDLILICLTGSPDTVEQHPAFRPDVYTRIVEKPISASAYARIWVEELAKVGKAPKAPEAAS